MLGKLVMNKFLFCKNYLLIFLLINSANIYLLAEEKNCLNYPYPDGIHKKKFLSDKKQLIYTKSVSIKSENKRKIEFHKKKNNLYAITSLNKYIKLYFPNLEAEEIGIYKLYSCFDKEGNYKISFAQREVALKSLNIFQKVKRFFEKNILN